MTGSDALNALQGPAVGNADTVDWIFLTLKEW